MFLPWQLFSFKSDCSKHQQKLESGVNSVDRREQCGEWRYLLLTYRNQHHPFNRWGRSTHTRDGRHAEGLRLCVDEMSWCCFYRFTCASHPSTNWKCDLVSICLHTWRKWETRWEKTHNQKPRPHCSFFIHIVAVSRDILIKVQMYWCSFGCALQYCSKTIPSKITFVRIWVFKDLIFSLK